MATKKKTYKKPVRHASSRSNTSRRRAPIRRNRLFIPYPLLAFLLLCMGVFLIGWTFKASADSCSLAEDPNFHGTASCSGDISVKVKVPAPPVTEPAVITSPTDGTHFTSQPITVSGTCPSNTYVELYRNNYFSGTDICSADNHFQITTDLFLGANTLIAHVFNVTDDEGPQSVPVTVYYDVPAAVKPTAVSSAPSATIEPFVLNSQFYYKGFYVGQDVQWQLEVKGGSAPYAINVDWGDGSSDLLSQKTAGNFTIDHTYEQPGGFKGSYPIRVRGSDADGRQAFLQFFVLVNPQNAAPVGSTTNQPPTQIFSSQNILKVLWPVYLILVLMSFSFWLGEREEFVELRRRGRLTRRRA